MIRYLTNHFPSISVNEANEYISLIVNDSGVDVYVDKKFVNRQEKINLGNDIVEFYYDEFKFAILIGDDVLIPEIGRLLGLKRYHLAICIDIEKKVIDEMLGPWNMSQSNNIYVAYYDNKFSLYAPCVLTKDYTGLINSDYVLSLNDLNKANESFPIYDSLNLELYEQQW